MGQKINAMNVTQRNAINGAVESAKNDQTVLSTMYSYFREKHRQKAYRQISGPVSAVNLKKAVPEGDSLKKPIMLNGLQCLEVFTGL